MEIDVNFKRILSQNLYVLRGIAIVLVVIGHVIGYNREYGMRKMYNSDLSALGWLCDFINTFHMPIFFIASGIAFAAFSNKNTSFGKFLGSKFEKLIIPLMCWAPFYFVFQSLSKGRHFNFADIIKATVYPYEIFWFLDALIIVTFLSFTCFKLFKSNLVYFSISIILFILGFGYWNLFYAFGVFIASYLYKIRLLLEKLPLVFIFIMGFCCMTIMIFTKYLIAVNNVEMARIVNGPIAFLFMYMVVSEKRILLPKRFDNLQHAVASNFLYLGTISMVIYLFHGYFTRMTIIIMTKFLGIPSPILYFIVVSFMGVLGPIILYKVLQRSKIFMYSIGAAK